MVDEALPARSLAEAFYHVMANACRVCRRGSMRPGQAKTVSDDRDTTKCIAIDATCRHCEAKETYTYVLRHGLGIENDGAPAVVNPTDRPSEIIDVSQWITIFRILTTKAAACQDRKESRRIGLEAAQCLDEALKFFDDPDSDLPPAGAFLNEDSLNRFRANPELFSRRRLLDLRAKLPTESAMRTRIEADIRPSPPKRRWWKLWN